jgi:U32 family peptidase
MSNNNKSVEIMAPAGSFESLAAALRAGADSIYFGVGNLNMRSRAGVNFTIDDLPKIARLCRRMGAKAYLTLNTIVYDAELPEIKKLCKAAAEAGINAVIASDIAAVQIIREAGLSVHMSVQTNICNLEAVKFYAQFADIVIPARELSLAQIENIIKGIKEQNITGPAGNLVQLEMFIHGALCVAYSGTCYMSLGMYNSSANRGACFQNCRRRYRVTDEATGDELVIDNHYVMSPKDLCSIRFIDRILDSGVTVLKLEGRGRSADYVNIVTSVYREAVGAWLGGTYTPDKFPAWETELQRVFNRGFWHGGYYLGEKLGEWSGEGGNLSKFHKIHLGKVTKYYSKLQVAELALNAGELSIGDEILITGGTTGALRFNVDALRWDNKAVQNAPKGAIVTIPVPRKVRLNDKLYIFKPRLFGDTPQTGQVLRER